MKYRRLWGAGMLFALLSFQLVQAQEVTKKYPSLFWEITGNGLKKPSYLFGTMHVSSKMVFHLSDSFYHALKNVDAVALELNPEKWQGDMFKMQQAQANLNRFISSEMSDYINEQSFQLTRYEDNLKKALNEEPTVVNSLLYRSYQSRADFEENTYLDLYIYQTGRKLGKLASGVEDYEQTEKLMLEAYQDMAKEKERKSVNTDGESMMDLDKKMQQAYRKGDLDMMDSLETITNTSPAFTEKFLYKRNEIQANSIDTILKNKSLFVGVGAAHLPGKRGVIELLRKKGYKLRPIFMQDRDASQKEQIDQLRVPVTFNVVSTADGLIKMAVPGQLYKREETKANESWQYADMNNGSYYMLTRVTNHSAMMGETVKEVLRKVDSMLYENIPGKIIKKTAISKSGYEGFDITNKTRRGDIQRYNIFVTPFEVLVFKMSGNDTYVQGKEAESFFNSIELGRKSAQSEWIHFQPKQGGFSVKLPSQPHQSLNKKSTDKTDRWEYEAVDEKTGDAYMIWKKSVYNINFLEEDTFDLDLVEESLKKSDVIAKQLKRKTGQFEGVPFVDMKYVLKNGQYLRARAFIKGPHYYLLAARGTNKANEFDPFFNSFSFTNYNYNNSNKYVDTILNIEVNTAIIPPIDHNLRAMLEKSGNEEGGAGPQVRYSYWPKSKTAMFESDSTGEAIYVSVETFPDYYYSKDSAKFWRDRIDEKKLSKEMNIYSKQFFKVDSTTCGYNLQLRDTNCSREIKMRYILKDNALFKFVTVSDTTNEESDFVRTFFTSFQPINKQLGTSVFTNKLDRFYADYYSNDSSIQKKARNAIPNVYFGKPGVQWLLKALSELKYTDKDYFDLKGQLINELGFINDSTAVNDVLVALKNVYNVTADTSYFQNAVLNALARLKTKDAYSFLKETMLQDPPVFENSYEYGRMFNYFDDSLSLARHLFPDILQLAQVDDYKTRLNSLLRTLVDSGLIAAKDYEPYFSKLYFDAKLQLKKQQVKDEKNLQDSKSSDDNDDRYYGRSYRQSSSGTNLEDYMVLLMPFYDKNPSVPGFFTKLLQSKDGDVQLSALTLLIKNKKPVNDTIFDYLATKDEFRARLYAALEKINRSELFPAKYKKQEDIARSLLLAEKSANMPAVVEFVKKRYMELRGQKGYVYYFKYKMKNDDDWRIGISGLQPVNSKDVSSNDKFVKLTERKLKPELPVDDQFEAQLKRMVFDMHKSSRQFFSSSSYRSFLGADFDDDDED